MDYIDRLLKLCIKVGVSAPVHWSESTNLWDIPVNQLSITATISLTIKPVAALTREEVRSDNAFPYLWWRPLISAKNSILRGLRASSVVS